MRSWILVRTRPECSHKVLEAVEQINLLNVSAECVQTQGGAYDLMIMAETPSESVLFTYVHEYVGKIPEVYWTSTQWELAPSAVTV